MTSEKDPDLVRRLLRQQHDHEARQLRDLHRRGLELAEDGLVQQYEDVVADCERRVQKLEADHGFERNVLERKLEKVPPFRFSAQIAHLIVEERMARAGKNSDVAQLLQDKRLALEAEEKKQYAKFVDDYLAKHRDKLKKKQDAEMFALYQRNVDVMLKTRRAVLAEFQRVKTNHDIHHRIVDHNLALKMHAKPFDSTLLSKTTPITPATLPCTAPLNPPPSLSTTLSTTMQLDASRKATAPSSPPSSSSLLSTKSFSSTSKETIAASKTMTMLMTSAAAKKTDAQKPRMPMVSISRIHHFDNNKGVSQYFHELESTGYARPRPQPQPSLTSTALFGSDDDYPTTPTKLHSSSSSSSPYSSRPQSRKQLTFNDTHTPLSSSSPSSVFKHQTSQSSSSPVRESFSSSTSTPFQPLTTAVAFAPMAAVAAPKAKSNQLPLRPAPPVRPLTALTLPYRMTSSSSSTSTKLETPTVLSARLPSSSTSSASHVASSSSSPLLPKHAKPSAWSQPSPRAQRVQNYHQHQHFQHTQNDVHQKGCEGGDIARPAAAQSQSALLTPFAPTSNRLLAF